MPLVLPDLDQSNFDAAARQLRGLVLPEMGQSLAALARRYGFKPSIVLNPTVQREEAADLLYELDVATQKSRLYAAAWNLAANVGFVPRSSLFNPAASTFDVVVLSATIACSAAGGVVFLLTNSDQAYGGNINGSHLNAIQTLSPDSTAIVESNNTGAAALGTLIDASIILASTAYSMFNLPGSNCPLLRLIPGTGMIVAGQTTNCVGSGHYRWAEVPRRYT